MMCSALGDNRAFFFHTYPESISIVLNIGSTCCISLSDGEKSQFK